MLFFHVCSAFVVSLFATNAVLATPMLNVKITGPRLINNVGDLKVSSTVTNTGNETLKLLHDPSGLLSDLPTNKFIVRNSHRVPLAFTGVKAKFVPTVAIGARIYSTLEPGQSISVEHDLSRAYDFNGAGEGEYIVQANELFYAIQTSGKVLPLSAGTEHFIMNIRRRLVTKPAVEFGILTGHTIFEGCSASEQSEINLAAPAAQRYVEAAYDYFRSHNSGSPRYTTWFGEYDHDRHGIALSHFQAMRNGNFSQFTYDCTCSKPEVFAYVYPHQFGKIHLCDAFWSAPTNGTDSKAGTLVHEASHFVVNGGTSDIAYGEDGARSLAIDNPREAVMNADSHEYFAENNPALA
ncbi:hypothetical protein AX17_002466 [Amanita inopinata Kibby_2008]|nr:hypothetical protein AX17_002466 [Amanita inopinata Kibby_2008]